MTALRRTASLGKTWGEDRQMRATELQTLYTPAIHASGCTLTRLDSHLNAPCSAADDVTLSLHAIPKSEEAMAETLAPVLNMGLIEIQRQAKAG